MLYICAIFRNEAPYLREWLEFHRLVGVDRFCLYQNNSDDNWERALRPYVDEGLVEVIDWPMLPPSQLPAFEHFIAKHRGEAAWAAFIDCDEFLFSTAHQTIPEALASEAFAGRGAVAVNWMCFGANGHGQWTDAPVIERFTTRPADDFNLNAYVKSIARLDRVIGVGPNAHQFEVSGGTFSERGQEVRDRFNWPPCHRLLRINHYVTKSRSEWLDRISRGMVDRSRPREPGEFAAYQLAELDDRAIGRFLPELRRRLERRPREKIPKPFDL